MVEFDPFPMRTLCGRLAKRSCNGDGRQWHDNWGVVCCPCFPNPIGYSPIHACPRTARTGPTEVSRVAQKFGRIRPRRCRFWTNIGQSDSFSDFSAGQRKMQAVACGPSWITSGPHWRTMRSPHATRGHRGRRVADVGPGGGQVAQDPCHAWRQQQQQRPCWGAHERKALCAEGAPSAVYRTLCHKRPSGTAGRPGAQAKSTHTHTHCTACASAGAGIRWQRRRHSRSPESTQVGSADLHVARSSFGTRDLDSGWTMAAPGGGAQGGAIMRRMRNKSQH